MDLRLSGFSSQTNYVTSAVRNGYSWSASVQPMDLFLELQRWEGAVIEERYEEGELDFIRVYEETLHDYTLPITQIEVSCTWAECSFSSFAGSE